MKQKMLGIILLTLLLSVSVASVAEAQSGHWGYSGEGGPTHWGELDPAYTLCATGTQQSPIEISGASPLDPAALAFDYQPSALTIVNNGHTIQANYDAGSTVIIDGHTYELVQFHFHNPSEHTVNGNETPMELHLVHRNSAGESAVIGVFLVEGSQNPALAPVFEHMPTEEGEPETIAGMTINAADLLPSQLAYWRYDGSLTTPPCSEGVKWHVMQTPVQVSTEQLAAYAQIFHGNARPVQPLNERHFIVGELPSILPVTGAATENPFVVVMLVIGLLAGLTAVNHAATQRKSSS